MHNPKTVSEKKELYKKLNSKSKCLFYKHCNQKLDQQIRKICFELGI